MILGDLPVILLDQRVIMNAGGSSEGGQWHATLDGWNSAPFLARDLPAELAHGSIWQPGFVGPRSLTLRGYVVADTPGVEELRRLRDLIVDFVGDPSREISLLVREGAGTSLDRTVVVRRAEGPEFAFEGCDRLRFAIGFVATDPRRYRAETGITLTGDTAPWVDSASTAEDTDASVDLIVPSGSTTGDMLLALFDIAAGAVNSVPAGWTAVVNGQPHSGTRRTYLYRRSAGAAEPGSYTWGLDTSTQWAGTMMRVRGSDLTVATAVSTPAATANLTWPTITPGMSRAMLLQMAGMDVADNIADNLVAPSNGVEVVAFGDPSGSGDNAAVYVAARRRLTEDPPEDWDPEDVQQEVTTQSIGYCAISAVVPPAKGPALVVTGGTAPVGAMVSWVGPSRAPGLVQIVNRGRHVGIDALDLASTDAVVVDIGAHRATIDGQASIEALMPDNQWWDLTPGESLITELRSSDNGTVDTVDRPTFTRGRAWRVTAILGGLYWATSEYVGVTAGLTYAVRAAFRSAGTNRSVRLAVEWRSASGSLISTSTGGSFPEFTGLWVEVATTFTAPAGAEIARLRTDVLDSAIGEIHYVDGIVLREGTDTERSRPANQIDLLGVASAQMRWTEADW